MQQRYIPVSAISKENPFYVVRSIAIAQLLIGSISFILALTAFFVRGFNPAYFEAPGWVGGLWIIATGILGIFSGRRNSRTCVNATYLGFCLFSCVFAIANVIFFTACVTNFPNNFYYYGVTVTQILDGIVLFLMVGELCLAFAASIYCCVHQLCAPSSVQANRFQYGRMEDNRYDQYFGNVQYQSQPNNRL